MTPSIEKLAVILSALLDIGWYIFAVISMFSAFHAEGRDKTNYLLWAIAFLLLSAN